MMLGGGAMSTERVRTLGIVNDRAKLARDDRPEPMLAGVGALAAAGEVLDPAADELCSPSAFSAFVDSSASTCGDEGVPTV